MIEFAWPTIRSVEAATEFRGKIMISRTKEK
jgi:hypothetical protein